jgi:hypothetical protein
MPGSLCTREQGPHPHAAMPRSLTTAREFSVNARVILSQ